MILTMADAQASAAASSTEVSEQPRLAIHGGPLLTHSVACGRRFVFRTGMPVTVHEFENEEGKSIEQPTWSDENVQVWAVPGYGYSSAPPNSSKASDSDSEAEVASDASSSQSSRTRSHEEFMETVQEVSSTRLDAKDQHIRRSVVSDMFESGWRHDKLIETTWGEVQKPATMFLRDPDTHQLIPFSFPPEASVPPDQKVFVRKPWPAALVGDLPAPPNQFARPTMSYIVRGYPQRGTFDAKKAKELGIRPGPMYKQLADGHALELENGTVVKPEMVLGPTKPGRGIAIIDLPAPGFVGDTLNRPDWSSDHIMTGIEAICWILGPKVIDDARVQSFMKARPTVKHIISSASCCPDYLAMDSSAASAIRLSKISREHFPIPSHDNRTIPQIDSLGWNGEVAIDTSIAKAAERGMKIQMEPKFEIQRDEVVPWLDALRAIRDAPNAVARLASSARAEIAKMRTTSDDAGTGTSGAEDGQFSDPEVYTLGTGSALPSKYRNVSATLLRIPGKGSYLFDCGENTIGQLGRVFGPKGLTEVLLDLKLIWISHLHADHHLGTMGVLKAWNKARTMSTDERSRNKMLYIASEENMMSFLNDYKPLSALAQSNVIQLVCNSRSGVKLSNGKPFDMTACGLNIRQLQTSAVKHCWGAQAVSVTFDNGLKCSYSGDCRPSSSFARIGKDSDVLVHEATFDDGMEGDAMAKKHSTTGEALAVAQLMRAKNVILTHFSQRYQKIPVMDNVKLPGQVKFEDGTDNAGAPPGPVDEAMDVDAPQEQMANGNAKVPATNNDSKAPLTWLEEATTSAGWTPHPRENSEQVGTTQTKPVAPATQNPRSSSSPTQSKDITSKPQSSPASRPEMHVCVAFDYMRVKVSDIRHMHKFTPALTALFEAEHPELAEPGPQSTGKVDKIAMMNGRRMKMPEPKGQASADKQAKVSYGTVKTSKASTARASSNVTIDTRKDSSSDNESSSGSGSGSEATKSRRQAKKEIRKEAQRAARLEKKRIGAEKQKVQDENGKARRERKEREQHREE